MLAENNNTTDKNSRLSNTSEPPHRLLHQREGSLQGRHRLGAAQLELPVEGIKRIFDTLLSQSYSRIWSKDTPENEQDNKYDFFKKMRLYLTLKMSHFGGENQFVLFLKMPVVQSLLGFFLFLDFLILCSNLAMTLLLEFGNEIVYEKRCF